MPCLRVLRIAALAGMLAVMPTNLVASARQAPGPAPVQIPPRVADGPSEILWDNWGVPHIFATTAVEVGYAYGWAQTHNHANRLLRLYGLARGRAAEYWGERYLLSDHVMRTVGIPAAGREGYAAQTAEFRRYLDAFAAGVNAYAREHPDQIPDEMQQVLPVQGADLVAHTQRVLFTFLSGGNDPPLVDFEGLPISVRPAGEPAPEPAPAPEAGSNGWAIAPGHAASGHSLLFANPHLPWDSDLSTQFEAQLVAPEASLDFYGTTLLGVPVPVIGFNDSLGWTHTVNTLDGFDLYALTTSGDGYVLDGEVR